MPSLSQLISSELIPRDSNYQPIAPIAGINPAGHFVPLKLHDNGDNTWSLTVVTTTTSPVGSTNSFFQDQTGGALSGAYRTVTFGFTSFSISVYNDSAEVIDFSFDGISVHGRLLVGEAVVQDYRSQPAIYLKTVSGNPASYRVSAY